MNFGQRMAKERKECENRLYERLSNAINKSSDKTIFAHIGGVNEELVGAIRTIEAMGLKPELHYNQGKIELHAVEYKRA